NEFARHVRGRRTVVQQNHSWSVFRAGLAIENFMTVSYNGMVSDHSHLVCAWGSPPSAILFFDFDDLVCDCVAVSPYLRVEPSAARTTRNDPKNFRLWPRRIQ